MSDFTIINSYDGSTVNANSGDTVTLTVILGAAIIVTQNLDQSGGQLTTLLAFGGLANLSLTYDLGVGAGTTRANAVFSYSGPATGTVRCGCTWTNGTFQELFFNLVAVAQTVPSQIPVVPAGIIDLDWDVLLRTVTSSVLGKIDGFKVPDNLQFAVIPQRAGGLISSGITALRLTLRPQGKFNCLPLLSVVLASPSLTGSSPNQFYAVNFTLSQQPIIDYFTQANDIAAGGTTGGPNTAQLAASLELEITESSGNVSTSDSVNILVFQSEIQPSPT